MKSLKIKCFSALPKSFNVSDFVRVFVAFGFAISVYVLIAIIKKQLNSKYSMNQILQILSVGVFEKIELNQAFTKIETSDKVTDTLKQLILFDS